LAINFCIYDYYANNGNDLIGFNLFAFLLLPFYFLLYL